MFPFTKKRFDLNEVPVVATLASAVCLVGLSLFLKQFPRGIELIYTMLKAIFSVDEDNQFYSYLDEYVVEFTALGIVTLVVGLLILFTEYWCACRKTWCREVRVFVILLPAWLLLVILFIITIYWFWVYYKIDRILYIYTILRNECLFLKKRNCSNILEFIAGWFPRDTDMKELCGDRLRDFCNVHVFKTIDYFQLSAISCWLIIIGLALFLARVATELVAISHNQFLTRA